MFKNGAFATALVACISLQSCKTESRSPNSDVKQRLASQSELEKIISEKKAWDDVRYVKFYMDSKGLMRAKLTKDAKGDNIEKELGLISWAPDTVSEATANFLSHPSYGARYLIDYAAPMSNKKKIINFMPLNGNFALHSRYLGRVGEGGLQANGKKDPSGHGCIRIADATGSAGGHEYLYKRARELQKTYGKPVPIVVDYWPFVAAKTQEKYGRPEDAELNRPSVAKGPGADVDDPANQDDFDPEAFVATQPPPETGVEAAKEEVKKEEKKEVKDVKEEENAKEGEKTSDKEKAAD